MHLEELIWKLTGGFTRVPIMRPHPWITVLHVSLWAALVLTLYADSEDLGCTPEIRVRRHTTYVTSLGQELVINCAVDFCDKSVPTVTWFKLLNGTYKPISGSSSSHIRTEWKEFNDLEGASFLIFQKILSSDSGLYQCQMANVMGHVINVSVHGEDSGCTPEIKVRRHTTYETSLGQELVINCAVDFCNKSVPTVTWFKLLNGTSKPISGSSSSHIRTEWKEFNDLEGASFLIFPKILSSDSGLYQCRMANVMGHVINVSVHGGGEHTSKNNTIPKTCNPEALEPMWMYMSSAARIVGFATVVIVITVVSIRWCKGKSKKGTQSECQCATIHMVERPLTRGGPPPESESLCPAISFICAERPATRRDPSGAR